MGEIRLQQERIDDLDSRQTQFTTWGQEMSDPWETQSGNVPNGDISSERNRRHSATDGVPPDQNAHGASKFATVVYSQIATPPISTPGRYEEWGKSLSWRL